MIGHIFKKDVKLLWRMALGVALLAFLTVALLLKIGPVMDYSGLYLMAELFSTIGFLGRGFLIAAVVHHDALPGARLDWLIRPIRRRDLLLAKVLFVVIMVQAPVLVADLLEALADGFSPGPAFGAALARSILLLCAFDLPMLAFASLTQNMLETVFGAVAVTIAGATSMALVQIRQPLIGSGPRIQWIGDLAMYAVLLLGALAVLGLQYFRRKTVPARSLTAVVIALALLTTLLPFQNAFAIEQSLSPTPGAANALAIGFAPGNPKIQAAPGYSQNIVLVYVPLQVSGIPSDSILLSDGLKTSLGQPIDRLFVFQDGAAGLALGVPTETYNQIKDQPVRLELDYSLTLLQLDSSHTLPALGADQRIPGVGWCGARASAVSSLVDLSCLQTGETSPCRVFYLEGSVAGNSCTSDYAPYDVQFGPDALRRFHFQFRMWKAPRDGAQVVLKTYRPQEHFKRSEVIPQIRLADWAVAQTAY